MEESIIISEMSVKSLMFNICTILLAIILLTNSVLPPGNQLEGLRRFTRAIEFDYIEWTLNALGVKLSQVSLGTTRYLPNQSHHQIVIDYLQLLNRIQLAEQHQREIYADPNIPNPWAVSALVRGQLQKMYLESSRLKPLAEEIIQEQTELVLAEMGLALGGQSIPPVMFHTTPLPMALIISPRHVIQQDANISLVPSLTIDEVVELEEMVENTYHLSALVVNIGGIGTYPTMVMEITDVNYLIDTVAHEWVHNYLSLRPLGINYLNSPQLRTMNETAASIAGNEISQVVMEYFYPELLPPPPVPEQERGSIEQPQPDVFDYRAEMHLTRVTVDQLLAEGKIEAAENYMEQRRILFWEQGYRHIRRLNQAYFAFYGAYADEPGGAAGEDPVGPAVRALRAQSPTLAIFLKRISWMTSFQQLQKVVGENTP